MVSRKLDLSTLILQFEVHNRSESMSPATVVWYNGTLNLFHRWLREERVSCLLRIWERKKPGSLCSISRRERGDEVSLPATR